MCNNLKEYHGKFLDVVNEEGWCNSRGCQEECKKEADDLLFRPLKGANERRRKQ